jgi:hypothetical protein
MLKRVGFAALVVLFTSGLFAQSRMMAGSHAATIGGHGFAPPVHPNGFRIFVGDGFNRRGFRRSGFFNRPYYAGFYPDYYPDYFYDSYENEPAPPPPAAEPPARQVVQERKLVQEPTPTPALLELQGSRWVKVDTFTMNPTQAEFGSQAPTVSKEMPPAVLVYRDGHTEELISYSIIGSSIYTKSDYWTQGEWTRTIQIADLDIPSTLKRNQQRGVKFELPSGPNEVVIRP